MKTSFFVHFSFYVVSTFVFLFVVFVYNFAIISPFRSASDFQYTVAFHTFRVANHFVKHYGDFVAVQNVHSWAYHCSFKKHHSKFWKFMEIWFTKRQMLYSKDLIGTIGRLPVASIQNQILDVPCMFLWWVSIPYWRLIVTPCRNLNKTECIDSLFQYGFTTTWCYQKTPMVENLNTLSFSVTLQMTSSLG